MKYKILIPLLLLLFGKGMSFAQPQQRGRQLIIENYDLEQLRQLSQTYRLASQRSYQQALVKARREGWKVKWESKEGKLVQLIALDERGNPVYISTYNTNAAQASNTDDLHRSPFNLQGQGMLIGEWDGGNVNTHHQQLFGRVLNADNSANSDHATHVCGTLIGNGTGRSDAKGMAPLGAVIANDFFDDEAEMVDLAADGLLVSNHSYGTVAGWNLDDDNNWNWNGDFSISGAEDFKFGFYDERTRRWDNIAFNAPFYLIVKAAGNDRDDAGPRMAGLPPPDGNNGTGFDCIPTSGTAKNILTVGAVGDDGSTMSGFSSWGPTDDGRIKPDIVANGTGLISSSSAGFSSYTSMGGTSMSSPVVAGSCILLQEHYQNTHSDNSMRASTLKALVLHTAADRGNPGPDYQFGWGLLNAKAAADLISQDVKSPEKIREEVLTSGVDFEMKVFVRGDEPFRVTLAWTDLPGTVGNDRLDDPTLKLVNDLDLRIQKDGTTWQPFVLNPASPGAAATRGDNFRDNVEQILISSPEPGEYTIRVSNKGSLQPFLSQVFSLITSGNCGESLTITNPISGSSAGYGAGIIRAVNKITGNANIHYLATSHIELLPGFLAQSGVTFKAQIYDFCPDPIVSAAFINPVPEGAYWESSGLVAPQEAQKPRTDHEARLFPNPFSETTRLEFHLPAPARVNVKVVNAFGQVMSWPVQHEIREAGLHQIDIKGREWPPGYYQCVIEVEGKKESVPMVKVGK